MGRQVKQEAQLNNKQRHTQRTNRLEEKRELVESTKQEEFSVPEESKNFSFHQKEEKVRATDPPSPVSPAFPDSPFLWASQHAFATPLFPPRLLGLAPFLHLSGWRGTAY